MTRLVKNEVARFEDERVADFKAMLEAYVEGMIRRQKTVRFLRRPLAVARSRAVGQSADADGRSSPRPRSRS